MHSSAGRKIDRQNDNLWTVKYGFALRSPRVRMLSLHIRPQ